METWLTDDFPTSLLEINGYNLIRLDRSLHETNNLTPKVGGGVLLYIKSSIAYSTKCFETLNCSSPNIKILWVSILNPKHMDYIVGITYRPPQGKSKDFTLHLKNSLNQIDDLDKIDVFILGDMNINYAEQKRPSRKHLKKLEDIFGLKHLIKEPTRISPRLCSTIDLILTNSQHISNSGVIPMNISDHEAIFLSRKKQKDKFITKFIDARSYVDYDKEDFQIQLLQLDWTDFYSLGTVTDLWECLLSHITTVADRMCPLRKIRIKDKPEQYPWISHEILEMIQDKIRLQTRALASKDKTEYCKS